MIFIIKLLLPCNIFLLVYVCYMQYCYILVKLIFIAILQCYNTIYILSGFIIRVPRDINLDELKACIYLNITGPMTFNHMCSLDQ